MQFSEGMMNMVSNKFEPHQIPFTQSPKENVHPHVSRSDAWVEG
jgi:hypothetical protein